MVGVMFELVLMLVLKLVVLTGMEAEPSPVGSGDFIHQNNLSRFVLLMDLE